jgi:predicted RNA-binding protein YlxR (DUF448 family)
LRHRNGPHRQCIGCRGVFPKGELLRFVHDSSDSVMFDESQRLEGRGYYLCPRQDCVTRAWKNRKGKALLKDESMVQRLTSLVVDSLLGSVERFLDSTENKKSKNHSYDLEESLRSGDVVLIQDDNTGQEARTLTEIAQSRGADVFAVPSKVLNRAHNRVIKKHSPKISPILRNLRFYERLSFKGREL